jgi:hypothetical protein
MAGHEGNRLTGCTMREWDSGGSACRECGRNAGHHFKWNASGRESLGLFAATAEDEWVSTFQAADCFARIGIANEQLVDVFLSRRADAVATFAYVNQLDTGLCLGKEFRSHECIVTNHIS